MYVIKCCTRDFRDEITRRNDSSCYDKEGNFIKDDIIETYRYKRRGLRYNLKISSCELTDDIIEEAYIPDTRAEYQYLKRIAKKIINGEFGNGEERYYSLKKINCDYFKAQSMVNYLMKNYRLFTKKDWRCPSE